MNVTEEIRSIVYLFMISLTDENMMFGNYIIILPELSVKWELFTIPVEFQPKLAKV